jgi:hypothetical protein
MYAGRCGLLHLGAASATRHHTTTCTEFRQEAGRLWPDLVLMDVPVDKEMDVVAAAETFKAELETQIVLPITQYWRRIHCPCQAGRAIYIESKDLSICANSKPASTWPLAWKRWNGGGATATNAMFCLLGRARRECEGWNLRPIDCILIASGKNCSVIGMKRSRFSWTTGRYRRTPKIASKSGVERKPTWKGRS